MITLPSNWCWTTLGDLVDGFQGGRNLNALGRPPEEREIGVLKVSAVTWGAFDPKASKALPAGEAAKPHEVVRKGDLLISRANTTELVGAVVLVDRDHPNLMLPDKILRLLYRKEVVEAAYLLHVLRTEPVRNYFRREATGTSDSMRNLSQPKFRSTPLPVPPLNEQRRIVAKIDALTIKSRRAKKALDAIPPLLDKLRQSILAAAFRGDLTADWRAAHPDVEPASKLLERIRTERRRRWEEAELAKMKAKGKVPADDRWKAKYQEPEPVDESGLPELPVGWCWASVDELTELAQYGTSAKTSDTEGVPVLRMGNILAGELQFRELKYLPSSHDEFPALLLRAGDVLFNRTNSPELVGKSAVYRGGEAAHPEPCSFASYLIRLQPIITSSELLAQYINSPHGRTWVSEQVSQQVGQANVNGSKLRALAVPIAPLKEQATLEILIHNTLAGIVSRTRGATKVAAQLKTFESSILAKAFRGELVPQDPNDEPASVLLERIRTESGVQPKQNSRRRKMKTA